VYVYKWLASYKRYSVIGISMVMAISAASGLSLKLLQLYPTTGVYFTLTSVIHLQSPLSHSHTLHLTPLHLEYSHTAEAHHVCPKGWSNVVQ